jgi:hypothetical protein
MRLVILIAGGVGRSGADTPHFANCANMRAKAIGVRAGTDVPSEADLFALV